MNNTIKIDAATCKKCMLCIEICPNKIFIKNDQNHIEPKPESVHICVQCGHCMAICSTKSISIQGLSYETDMFDLPVYDTEQVKTSFFNTIQTRRSIRNFKDIPVPKEILEKIVAAISYAPPGFPPIKHKLIVVQNTELIRKSLPIMVHFYDGFVRMMKNPIMKFIIKKSAGSKQFKTLENHLLPMLNNRLPALKNGSEDTLFRNAPAIILFIADKNEEDLTRDIVIAATYGMLTAHAIGLGGCILDIVPPAINRDKALRKIYDLSPNDEVITSLIVGYPKYTFQRGIKRNIKRIKWL